MKYYLIKSVNNIPFIFGQFNSKEEAVNALQDTSKQPLVNYEIVCNIEDSESLQEELDHNAIQLKKAISRIEQLLEERSVLLTKNERNEEIISALKEGLGRSMRSNLCLKEKLDELQKKLDYEKDQFRRFIDHL